MLFGGDTRVVSISIVLNKYLTEKDDLRLKLSVKFYTAAKPTWGAQ